MSAKKNELDVDFIGEQIPLKKSEEKFLGKYFKQKKASLRLIGNKTTNPKTTTK